MNGTEVVLLAAGFEYWIILLLSLLAATFVIAMSYLGRSLPEKRSAENSQTPIDYPGAKRRYNSETGYFSSFDTNE